MGPKIHVYLSNFVLFFNLLQGGSLRSEQWRMEVDSVVANVALIASEESLSPSLIFEDTSCKEESLAFASGAFQLAAYQAFLASILSPCTHRPPFLSQALSVFRKGFIHCSLSFFCNV